MFKPGPNYVVVVEIVALGQIFLPIHLFSPISIILPIFHSDIHIISTLN